MANGQLVRFPVVSHFRYIGTREIHGITYLPVGTMQRHDAYLMTEVRLWRTVFSANQNDLRQLLQQSNFRVTIPFQL